MSLKTLFKWHLWLGLISGVCMFLVGLTGAVAVFAAEIDWLVIPPLRVSAPAAAKQLDVETILDKVRAKYPDARVGSLNLSVRPSFAHVAALQVRRDGRNARVDAYVNPFTGEVQGERAVTGGYTASVYQFLRQSHVRLLLGFWGRVFVGVCGISLVLSCITGLWIYRGWIKKMFQLRLGGGWGARTPWAEMHKFIGVWSLLFNLLIGVTGAVLGLENLTSKIENTWLKKPSAAKTAAVAAAAVEGDTPATAPAVAPPTKAATAARARAIPSNVAMLPINTLLANARAAFPDLTPRVITFPARPGAALSIRGEVPSMLVAQSHVRSANGITLNSATGEVINKVDGRALEGWKRAYWMIDPLHFGYFGGLPTKIIWFIFGLTPSVLAVTGTLMWWRRRKRATQPARLPVPVAPTDDRALRWIGYVVGALTLVGAYVVVARTLNTWTFNARMAEFWLVKPITLALVAFPVTGLLLWTAYRVRRQLWAYGGTCVLLGGWYLLLARILAP
ncbi:MAG TPA: PepSY-associated TM helix domain-containing protein [Opitutaceae bacterium]|nr:PepSY-associated TM helix domain-containing protein [Opitutaceae bacterium]